LKPFEVIDYSATLYHGSTKPVDRFEVGKGAGRYGSGLYLTPDLETAKFYASGGRQGNAGQRLKDGGFLYEFRIAGKCLKILDEYETLREMVGDHDGAAEAFESVGDVESAKVTKFLGEWISQSHGCDIVWLADNQHATSPLPQVLVTDQSVIKSSKPLKRSASANLSLRAPMRFSDGFVRALAKLVDFIAVGSLPPGPDYPPANIKKMADICRAKGREDLAQKIMEQWARVLEKYPATRVNWPAAVKIGTASITKNVFGHQEFSVWLDSQAKLTAEEARSASDVKAAIPAGTPAIAVPTNNETPEDWQAEAKKTEAMLASAGGAFKTANEFLAWLTSQAAELKAKVAQYGPGGAKHTLKSGKPHAFVQKIPKWQAQLEVFEKKVAEVQAEVLAAAQKMAAAAAAYQQAPVTTVAYEKKAQEALTEVLEYILDLKDLEKKKKLLQQFNESLKQMDAADQPAAPAEGGPQKAASSIAQANALSDTLSRFWHFLTDFWHKLKGWASNLGKSVDKFEGLATLSAFHGK
jgi:hypothetical protein